MEQIRQELLRLIGDFDEKKQLDTDYAVQPVELGTLEQLSEKAMANNPEIRALQFEVDSLRYTNRARMQPYRPRLTLNGAYGYGSPDRTNWIDRQAEQYSLTLNLVVPLFRGFASFAESDVFAEQLVQREKDLAIRRVDLRRSLARALVTVHREFNRLKLTKLSAGSAQRAMEAGLKDYRSGLLSSTDVLNIQRTRFEADRQFTTAQFSYGRQILSLRRDLGVDLEKTYVAR